jgi:hypothetical protein
LATQYDLLNTKANQSVQAHVEAIHNAERLVNHRKTLVQVTQKLREGKLAVEGLCIGVQERIACLLQENEFLKSNNGLPEVQNGTLQGVKVLCDPLYCLDPLSCGFSIVYVAFLCIPLST